MRNKLKNFDGIEMLKNKVKDYCGLTFEGQRHSFFVQKVTERIKALDLSSISEYMQYLLLESNKTEWHSFINAVTINETYFFREEQQFKVMIQDLLPKLMKTRMSFRCIRILSAACANGAEPYSLAILLNKKSLQKSWHIEIEAGDINKKNLERAWEGCYKEFDLRNTDSFIKTTFFEEHNSHYILIPSIRKQVRFFQMNLLDFSALRRLKPYDIIFCRNVLYYFDIPTREKVVNALANILAHDGYLFVGQTEFIGKLSIPFKMCRKGEVIYYQKTQK